MACLSAAVLLLLVLTHVAAFCLDGSCSFTGTGKTTTMTILFPRMMWQLTKPCQSTRTIVEEPEAPEQHDDGTVNEHNDVFQDISFYPVVGRRLCHLHCMVMPSPPLKLVTLPGYALSFCGSTRSTDNRRCHNY